MMQVVAHENIIIYSVTMNYDTHQLQGSYQLSILRIHQLWNARYSNSSFAVTQLFYLSYLQRLYCS